MIETAITIGAALWALSKTKPGRKAARHMTTTPFDAEMQIEQFWQDGADDPDGFDYAKAFELERLGLSPCNFCGGVHLTEGCPYGQ